MNAEPIERLLCESIEDLKDVIELRDDQKEMLGYAVGALAPLLFLGTESWEEVDEFVHTMKTEAMTSCTAGRKNQ